MSVKPAFITLVSLLTLPFLFFGVLVFVTLGSSFLILIHSTAEEVKDKIERPVYSVFNAQPPVLGVMDENVAGTDGRGALLTQYFASHQAPLAPYGQELVSAADRYSLDWRLLPAIAMLESNGGKKIPDGSHNAWGWAIHSTYTKLFDSWEQAIETVARGIKTEYVDKGLTTPCQIMTKYNPISTARGGSWCHSVEYFIWDIENF
jgi:hypothetical protein